MQTAKDRSRNIFLVGPMGVGKTTIGRLLAAELDLTFKDTDHEIEERAGADISWIFDMEGESGFRAREKVVIEELTRLPGVLLSTGGGSIVLEENRKCLQSRGTVIFLDTTVDLQLERTKKDKNRPLLQIDNPRSVLTELKNTRDPLYNEIADLRIFAGGGSGRKTVSEIMKRLVDEGYIKD
jgi:shikimate kinase